MPALTPLVVRETRPGPEVQDDASLLDYMRDTIQTSWHMVGNVQDGVDAAAVVDPDLRVRHCKFASSILRSALRSRRRNEYSSIATWRKSSDMMLARPVLIRETASSNLNESGGARKWHDQAVAGVGQRMGAALRMHNRFRTRLRASSSASRREARRTSLRA
jgi:hypothetical protein